MEEAHRSAQETSRRRCDAVEDREIEQVEAPRVAQRGEVLPARQQGGDGRLIDREIVGQGRAAAQQERVDAVEALPAELLIARAARADRRQRHRRIVEEVVVGLQAARAVEVLFDDADAKHGHRRHCVPQHPPVLVGREFLTGGNLPRMAGKPSSWVNW